MIGFFGPTNFVELHHLIFLNKENYYSQYNLLYHVQRAHLKLIHKYIVYRNNIQYIIFNLVPENFKNMSKEEQNIIIDMLVDRIALRLNNDSPLQIDPTNLEESRAAAKRKIIFGFVTQCFLTQLMETFNLS